MQLQALRYFMATSESGSVRAASERVHIAPSAISRQIGMLEYELQAPLFERLPSGMQLTSAGLVLQREARVILGHLDRIRSEVEELNGCVRGNVRVWSSECAISDFLFPLSSEFQKSHPGVTIEIRLSSSRSAFAALMEHKCDVAIVFDPEPNPRVNVIEQTEQPICAFWGPEVSLPDDRPMKLEDLQGQRLCLLDHGYTSRQLFERAAASKGLKFDPVMTINSLVLTKYFVGLGRCVGIMPQHGLPRDGAAGSFKFAELDHPLLRHVPLAVCTLKERMTSPLLDRFLDQMRIAFRTALRA